MNCQAWLYDHVIPVYNTGIKTFINYVDKSLPVLLMKATNTIWKHNLQVLCYICIKACSSAVNLKSM